MFWMGFLCVCKLYLSVSELLLYVGKLYLSVSDWSRISKTRAQVCLIFMLFFIIKFVLSI